MAPLRAPACSTIAPCTGSLVFGAAQDPLLATFAQQGLTNMDLAYVYIYSTAFTAATVAARAPLGSTCPAHEPLRAAWVFDGASATSATDISGNGALLSIEGGAGLVSNDGMPTCSMLCPGALGPECSLGGGHFLKLLLSPPPPPPGSPDKTTADHSEAHQRSQCL